jgi:hypothetical protein
MFSATKYLVAGAIVALLGGLLVTGPLMQGPDDRLVPGVQATASADAASSPDASPAVGLELNDELVPGVSLVTKQVEPGVYQVLHDGVRSLDGPGLASEDRSILALPGEPIRIFAHDRAFVVGDGSTGSPPAEGFGDRDTDFEVDPHDDLLAGDPSGLYRLSIARPPRTAAGERWVKDRDFGDRHIRAIEIGPDGTTWVLWCRGGMRDNACHQQRLHRSGPDGWVRVDVPDAPELAHDLRADNRFAIDADGGLWLATEGAGLLHYDGAEWSVWDPMGRSAHQRDGFHDGQVGVGADGTLWAYFLGSEDPGQAYLVRRVGEEWEIFDQDDGVPARLNIGMGAPGILTVADDGSVWLVGDHDGAAVWHFDGSMSETFLRGVDVGTLELTADSQIWMHVQDPDQRYAVQTFVMTPEAVAATD